MDLHIFVLFLLRKAVEIFFWLKMILAGSEAIFRLTNLLIFRDGFCAYYFAKLTWERNFCAQN